MKTWRRIYSVGMTAVFLAVSALPAAPQMMEGDHLFLGGMGRMGTNFRIKGVRSDDVTGPVPADFAMDPRMKAKNIATIQYLYQLSAPWSLGLTVDWFDLSGIGSWHIPPFGQVQGDMSVAAKSVEILPIARYTAFSYRRFNPYFLAGLGLNHFSTSVSQFSFAPSQVSAGTVYAKTSTGLAATIGVGVQVQVINHLLAGVEGRWTYLQIDPAFGRSYWTNFAGYLWIGTKWNAPL